MGCVKSAPEVNDSNDSNNFRNSHRKDIKIVSKDDELGNEAMKAPRWKKQQQLWQQQRQERQELQQTEQQQHQKQKRQGRSRELRRFTDGRRTYHDDDDDDQSDEEQNVKRKRKSSSARRSRFKPEVKNSIDSSCHNDDQLSTNHHENDQQWTNPRLSGDPNRIPTMGELMVERRRLMHHLVDTSLEVNEEAEHLRHSVDGILDTMKHSAVGGGWHLEFHRDSVIGGEDTRRETTASQRSGSRRWRRSRYMQEPTVSAT